LRSHGEINRLEEGGDRLYTEALHDVFADGDANPLTAFAWSKIYDYMEDVCDACEDVADHIEDVVLKNN
jgi:uncharacterized protein Yka (UPF0111/DUF47 family)